MWNKLKFEFFFQLHTVDYFLDQNYTIFSKLYKFLIKNIYQ